MNETPQSEAEILVAAAAKFTELTAALHGQDAADRLVAHFGSQDAVAARGVELMRRHLDQTRAPLEKRRSLYPRVAAEALSEIEVEVRPAPDPPRRRGAPAA
jgi:hypothetical protein